MLVLIGLRLALGCHFLYEGMWKIKHADEFSAQPFLAQAKGPLAQYFYRMLPDIDGRQRLHVETDASGKKSINSEVLVARWNEIRQQFLAYYRPANPAGAAGGEYQKLEQASEETCNHFKQWLQEYLDAKANDIAAYFGALDRFQGKTHDPHAELGQDAPFQKQRHWDRMMELRHEADGWIKDIDAQEKAYKHSLYALLSDQQKAREPGGRRWNPYYWGRGPMAFDWGRSWNPLLWARMDQINFVVTYGLTAIGLCLLLGLCSRLAALAGAAFMCCVVLTQPAFPGIYPPDPAVLGHALLINKDFIEMLALLVIASVPAGRWGGLDFFLYHILRSLAYRWVKKDSRVQGGVYGSEFAKR